MKKVKCSGPGCSEKRVSWCNPDTPRGPQYVEVKEDYEGKAWCSITCAVMGGAMSLKWEPDYNNPHTHGRFCMPDCKREYNGK
jgi:hypothetical protein